MPRYLNTLGRNCLAVAICDRCKVKMPLELLSGDRNSPGLLVCTECNDLYDPYRLPARRTEDISLPASRPDVPLRVDEP